MLPDSPSIDYLRRQAKDLLVGLREVRPDTSLADAQAALARQYGFRVWPELKAEVDRRRGRAEIADTVVAETLASRFILGAVVAPMRSLARADEIGRSWALETITGRWSVRQLNDWFDTENAESDVQLQEAAREAGMLLPRPVRSDSGAIVERIDGHNWRVNAWIESGPPLSAPVGAPVASLAGSVLARLHGLALPAPRPIELWHIHRRPETEWTALADRAANHGAAWAGALQRALPNIMDLRAMGAGVEVPQAILCHCNFGPGNARITARGDLAVLGWEHAGALPPSWELATALVTWCVGSSGDPPNVVAARAFLDSYRTSAGHRPEIDLYSFTSTVSGWLNYVYGQVCLALDTADADDRSVQDRNVVHLLAHAPTRSQYERVLDAALVAT